MEIMMLHSFKGYEYLKNRFNIPSSSKKGVLEHHEKHDGSGYPAGKRGKDISLFGKIIAISDVYDALTSDRPYRKAVTPSDAIEYVMGGSDSQFDREVVKSFIQKIAPYPIGTTVLLSDGSVGIVLENHSDCCLRPKVKIIAHMNIKIEPYVIDLRNDMNLLDIVIIDMSAGEFTE